MPVWVRAAVMLTVTAVWAVVVLTSLWRGQLPDAITWGVPAGVWFAMHPVIPRKPTASSPPPAGPAGET